MNLTTFYSFIIEDYNVLSTVWIPDYINKLELVIVKIIVGDMFWFNLSLFVFSTSNQVCLHSTSTCFDSGDGKQFQNLFLQKSIYHNIYFPYFCLSFLLAQILVGSSCQKRNNLIRQRVFFHVIERFQSMVYWIRLFYIFNITLVPSSHVRLVNGVHKSVQIKYIQFWIPYFIFYDSIYDSSDNDMYYSIFIHFLTVANE